MRASMRRLDLRAPEDRFATDDQIEERFGRRLEVPGVEGAINRFLRAWANKERPELASAADDLVKITRDHFGSQGVPVFAHPILPPQFTQRVADALGALPDLQRGLALGLVTEAFGGALRTGVAQELRLAAPSGGSTRALAAPPVNVGDPMARAPTWVRPSTFWERRRQRQTQVAPNSPPPPIIERSWQQERQDRARDGARERQRQEAYDNAWAMFGFPLSPEEELRRQLIGDVVRRGDRPIFYSGKEAHPDDPYKDRVAYPTNPNPGDQEVVVTGPFGRRTFYDNGRLVNDFHPGTDFRNQKNQPVFSPKNGTILRIVPNAGGAGDMVYILHDDGSISAFFHTQSLNGMEEGDEVYAGQRVGISNGSGKGDPHTHYSYFPPGTPIDPRTGLPMRGSDDHDRNAPARTQTDTFGPDGPYGRPAQQRPPFRIKP